MFFCSVLFACAQVKSNLPELFLCESGVYLEDVAYQIDYCLTRQYDSTLVVGDENSLVKIDSSNVTKVVFHGEPYYSTVSVFGYSKGVKTLAVSQKFHFLPSPYKAQISSILDVSYSGRNRSKESFKGAFVFAKQINIVDAFFCATSFSMIYEDLNGKMVRMNGSCEISDEMYNSICTLPSGHELIFDNIYIESYKYGFQIKVDPIVVFLK